MALTPKKVKELEATTGTLFIVSVINNKGPISFLPVFRLQEKFFSEDELKLIKIIQKYVDLYKDIPDKTTVEIEGNISLPDAPLEGSVQFWADEVRKRYSVETSYSMCKNLLAKITDGDIDTASDISSKLSRVLMEGASKTKVYALEDVVDTVIDLHDKAKLKIKESGVPFGLDFLDDKSGGAQAGDLITIAGRPSAGKTFLLLDMAISAHAAGNSVLIVPTEMSEIQYQRRLIGLRNNISINSIKFGTLSTFIGREIIKYDKEILSHQDNKIYLTDASMSLGVGDVKSAAYIYKPSAIYIDGAYLLRAEVYTKNRYEQVSSVAESIKMLAKELNVPVFATYQLNKKTEDIYQSDVVRQLSSIVLEMSDYTEIEDNIWGEELKPKLLNITKGRDGEEGSVIVLVDTDHTRIIQSTRDPNNEQE